LNKTSSVLGQQLLKEWVSRPSRDKRLLDARHASIDYLSQPIVRDKVLEIALHLRYVKDINRLLSRVRETKATSNDWQYILKVCNKCYMMEYKF
jgi:DNA mismatch repair ATPase MutS